MGYGVQRVWVIWTMAHMGNGYRGMGHMGNGVQEYEAHGQWGTGGMGYRGIGHMGNGTQQAIRYKGLGHMDSGVQGK